MIDFGNGIIASNSHPDALTYDDDTIVIIVDGTSQVDGGSIDEIVYVEDDEDASDVVVLVPDDDDAHADYIFIIR